MINPIIWEQPFKKFWVGRVEYEAKYFIRKTRERGKEFFQINLDYNNIGVARKLEIAKKIAEDFHAGN